MSSHEENHQETPKRVYFGVPFAFACAFWLIVFCSLKACDGPKDCCEGDKECCKGGAKTECCDKDGRKDCSEHAGHHGEAKEVAKEEVAPAAAEATEPTAEAKDSTAAAPATHE